ncbi:hypothetical protein HUJ04_003260 [Dendroctonus ponderosae]|uniref:Transposable element P transposase-like RNase H C-terminal domain-containing protein n=1 Tax=Dendroctonus ponderosae TaxID=77166 RepID=A0AAR5Q673_DENPD|nr:hypothetical protein HUJ04_003260 [Dendroctonus ponderosae]
MKVKCCTQVFSYQVGALMKRIISWKSQVNMDSDAIDTAELILFLDKLFDSLNSSRRTGPPGKPLKASVTLANSEHVDFWKDAVKILSSMKYFCPKKQKFVSVPSLRNFIHTLNGFVHLSKEILKEHPKKFLTTRTFQQDALENFFGCIRSYSGRENTPSASHFISSYRGYVLCTEFCIH